MTLARMVARMVLVIALACCRPAVGEDAAVFLSELAGIEVLKPADWHFVSAARNLENLKSLRFDDAQQQAELKKYMQAPLLIIAKHPDPFADLNPTFKVDLRSAADAGGRTPVEFIETVLLPTFRRGYKDLVVTQPPTETTVAGKAGAYLRMNYTLTVRRGRSVAATAEMWIVPRGEYLLVMGAGTRQDEKTGTREEIAAIVGNMKIDGSDGR